VARPTRVKIKRGDQWVYVDELDQVREQENQEAREAHVPGPIVINTLPRLQDLDDEVPYDQLTFEHPEVNPYIVSVDGGRSVKIRMGLSPEQHCIAEQIIARFKKKIRKKTKKTTHKKKVAKKRSKRAC